MQIIYVFIAMFAFSTFDAQAQSATPTSITCEGLRKTLEPTPEALERFSDLEGSCEGVVERNGLLYMKISAVVRRARGSSVQLYLPATDHTFKVTPKPESRVIIDGKKIRPRDLQRGQEISIYLLVSKFAQIRPEIIALISESDEMIEEDIEYISALPTTASSWPTIALCGLLLIGAGIVSRRVRKKCTYDS